MPEFVQRTELPFPVETVFQWHANPRALNRLLPPWERARIIRSAPSLADGTEVELEVHRGPLKFRWVARHTGYIEGKQFQDEQVSGPFKRWIHTHRFEPVDANRSALEDRIVYEPPAGGQIIPGLNIQKTLERAFEFRKIRLTHDLERHTSYTGPPLRIAITGSSGHIGSALRDFLESGGHQVLRVVRKESKRPNTVGWNVDTGELDEESLGKVDAFVHLAGENIGSGVWTNAKKKAIRESRVAATRKLAERLAALERKPDVLITASAVGYYGNRGYEVLDESSGPGKGFLADVAAEWENASHPAEEAGIRVAKIRTGVVLSTLLPRMLPAFNAGLGAPFGKGTQYMSWVSRDDVIGAIHHLITHPTLSGAFNVTAPNAVTNEEFTKTLASLLHRPSLFRIPAFALKLLPNDMADELMLASAWVTPKKLTGTGFEFHFDTLENALRFELGRYR